MKLRRLLLFALVIAVAAAGAATVAVRAARATPDWYVERLEQHGDPEQDPEAGGVLAFLGGLFGLDSRHASSVAEQLQELALTGRVELDDERLRAVIETAMAGTSDGRATLGALDRPQVQIGESRIEYGGGFDIDEIDDGALSEDAGRVVRRLRDWVPLLRGRTIYVGLSAIPRAIDGDLHLSRDATLVIGKLRVPSWMVPARDLWGRLDFDLRLLELTDAQIAGERLILEAVPSGTDG